MIRKGYARANFALNRVLIASALKEHLPCIWVRKLNVFIQLQYPLLIFPEAIPVSESYREASFSSVGIVRGFFRFRFVMLNLGHERSRFRLSLTRIGIYLCLLKSIYQCKDTEGWWHLLSILDRKATSDLTSVLILRRGLVTPFQSWSVQIPSLDLINLPSSLCVIHFVQRQSVINPKDIININYTIWLNDKKVGHSPTIY